MAVWQRQARDGSGDVMRLRLEVTGGPKRVAGAQVLDRRRKRGTKKNVLAGKQQVKISIFKMSFGKERTGPKRCAY